MTSIKMILIKNDQHPGPALRGEGFDPLIRQLRNRLGMAGLAERNRLGHEARILREAERLRDLTPERFRALPENERTERRVEIERLAGSLKTYRQKNPAASRTPQFQAALQNVDLLRQLTAPNESGFSIPVDNSALIINFLPIYTGRIHSITSNPDKTDLAAMQQLPKIDHLASPERTIIISAILSDNLAVPSNSELGPTYQLTEQFKAELRTIKAEQTTAQQKRSADAFLTEIKSVLKASKEALLRQQEKDER